MRNVDQQMRLVSLALILGAMVFIVVHACVLDIKHTDHVRVKVGLDHTPATTPTLTPTP